MALNPIHYHSFATRTEIHAPATQEQNAGSAPVNTNIDAIIQLNLHLRELFHQRQKLELEKILNKKKGEC